MLGYIARFSSMGGETVASIMMAVPEGLEQSSRMAETAWLTTLRRIAIPFLKLGIMA